MSVVTRCVSSLQICRWKLSETLFTSSFSVIRPLRNIHRYSRVVSTPSLLPRQFSVSSFLHTSKPSVETENKTSESKESKSKEDAGPAGASIEVPAAKPTVFQQLKQMSKDYWYVLIPVHIVTSIGWFGGFYCAVKRYSTFAVLVYIQIILKNS